jgi:hypothetical protein
MIGSVVIDTNLLVLLVVGSASEKYISQHKRLEEFTIEHFDLLNFVIADFSEIVLLPHILAETSSLAAHIRSPAREKVMAVFRQLIETCPELPIPSIYGAQRGEFVGLGLTDAMMLHFCAMDMRGISPTLLTADSPLADKVSSMGGSVVDFRREFLG